MMNTPIQVFTFTSIIIGAVTTTVTVPNYISNKEKTKREITIEELRLKQEQERTKREITIEELRLKQEQERTKNSNLKRWFSFL